MIILNPLTFAEIRIDETKLTPEQVEIFKRVSIYQKKINRLQGKQWLEITRMEDATKMKFTDVLNKVKI